MAGVRVIPYTGGSELERRRDFHNVRDKAGPQCQILDPAGFDAFYEQWSDAVFRYLIHLVGARGQAEDLFQETWMKAIEYRRQLRESSRFGPWILRIARNLAFNQMRASRRKGQVWIMSNLASPEPDGANDLIERKPDRSPDPRQRAITNQQRRVVQEIIASLGPETQEMLQLRYFEHLSLAEVAEVMNVPLGTVCARVHRALKSIRSRMKSLGYSSLEAI